jgi:hypothetical protein
MAGLSPTQRTIRSLKEQGMRCAVVEKWNAYAGEFGKRIDLFNIIDILALDSTGVIGIQACGTDFKKHFEKLTVEHAEESIDWLKTPCTKLFIYSWRKLKLKRGGLAMRWTPRIVEITLQNFNIKLPEPGK